MFLCWKLCFQENQFLRITHQGEILRSMRLTVKVVGKPEIIFSLPNVQKVLGKSVQGMSCPVNLFYDPTN